MSKIDTALDRATGKFRRDLEEGYEKGLYKSENFDSYLMGRIKGQVLISRDVVRVDSLHESVLDVLLTTVREDMEEVIDDFLDGEEPAKFDVLEASLYAETIDAETDEEGSLVFEEVRYELVFTVYSE